MTNAQESASERRKHRRWVLWTALVGGFVLVLLGGVLVVNVVSSDMPSCPTDEWVQGLSSEVDAMTPEGASIDSRSISDCDGQRAVIGRFSEPLPRAEFCKEFQENAEAHGWSVLPARESHAIYAGGRYCGLYATKVIDGTSAYIFMGPTAFYAAPHPARRIHGTEVSSPTSA